MAQYDSIAARHCCRARLVGRIKNFRWLLLRTFDILSFTMISCVYSVGGAAQSRVARQSSATTTDVGCTDVSATRISCEDLNVSGCVQVRSSENVVRTHVINLNDITLRWLASSDPDCGRLDGNSARPSWQHNPRRQRDAHLNSSWKRKGICVPLNCHNFSRKYPTILSCGVSRGRSLLTTSIT